MARDAAQRPTALLPLGLQRQGALRIAGFVGAKDSNFNMGLFTPGVSWSRPVLTTLLRRAAAASGPGIDLFALRNQPLAWEGHANPLAALPHQASPSFAYKTTLVRDGEAFLQTHLSREARKKIRQKRNRLAALGPVTVVEGGATAEAADVIDAFMEQRAARNLAMGFGIDDLPMLRRFLDRAAGPDGPITFYGLRCGDRIVATLGGLRHAGRFSGMLTSFAAESDIARASPGELLLADVITRHCAAGFSTFDLGIGEARYKETYCPEVEELFDSLVPVTARGHIAAQGEALRLRAKRAIKQSRWAWPLAQKLRRARGALTGGAAAARTASGSLPDEAARQEE